MATWPSLEDLAAMLRISIPPDPAELGFIQGALDAANDYGNRRTNYKYDPDDPAAPAPPPVVHQAALQHASKLVRRRDSIDGVLGFGDAGVVRATGRDADVELLYASVGPMVVG